MVVLALETVTPEGSLAVWRDGSVTARAGDARVPHAARLPEALVGWLREHGLSLADVTRLVVVGGPGSFTGVRIGVACIQGLAATRGLPVAQVSTLDALAEGWRTTAAGREPRTVVACLDGMRGEVFTAPYRWEGATLTRLDDPAVQTAAPGVLAAHTPPLSVVGNGAVRYAALWRAHADEIIAAVEPLAGSAARLAASEAWPLVAPHALRPAYVRRPDVELARDRRPAP